MSLAVQKTLVFIFLIVVGFLLRRKMSGPASVKGIKAIILNLALPATIFIALLKIEVDFDLLFLPVVALLINILLMGGAWLSVYIMGGDRESSSYRSIMMLFPSFAPGLSCFPFLMEYFSDETLASAALADVGNKVFVLILLYLLAMHWYYRKQRTDAATALSKGERLKDLGLSLIREPINMVMVIAIILVSLGLHMENLPFSVRESISRLSSLMTPLILLFIGLSVRIGRKDLSFILRLLLLRSGMAFVISAALMTVLPAGLVGGMAILLVIFPQSACSFWPYAHMTAVDQLEAEDENKTFDLQLSLNVLAFSLPFSTAVVLTVCTNTGLFLQPGTDFLIGAAFITIAAVPRLVEVVKAQRAGLLSPAEKELKEG